MADDKVVLPSGYEDAKPVAKSDVALPPGYEDYKPVQEQKAPGTITGNVSTIGKAPSTWQSVKEFMAHPLDTAGTYLENMERDIKYGGENGKEPSTLPGRAAKSIGMQGTYRGASPMTAEMIGGAPMAPIHLAQMSAEAYQGHPVKAANKAFQTLGNLAVPLMAVAAPAPAAAPLMSTLAPRFAGAITGSKLGSEVASYITKDPEYQELGGNIGGMIGASPEMVPKPIRNFVGETVKNIPNIAKEAILDLPGFKGARNALKVIHETRMDLDPAYAEKYANDILKNKLPAQVKRAEAITKDIESAQENPPSFKTDNHAAAYKAFLHDRVIRAQADISKLSPTLGANTAWADAMHANIDAIGKPKPEPITAESFLRDLQKQGVTLDENGRPIPMKNEGGEGGAPPPAGGVPRTPPPNAPGGAGGAMAQMGEGIGEYPSAESQHAAATAEEVAARRAAAERMKGMTVADIGREEAGLTGGQHLMDEVVEPEAEALNTKEAVNKIGDLTAKGAGTPELEVKPGQPIRNVQQKVETPPPFVDENGNPRLNTDKPHQILGLDKPVKNANTIGQLKHSIGEAGMAAVNGDLAKAIELHKALDAGGTMRAWQTLAEGSERGAVPPAAEVVKRLTEKGFTPDNIIDASKVTKPKDVGAAANQDPKVQALNMLKQLDLDSMGIPQRRALLRKYNVTEAELAAAKANLPTKPAAATPTAADEGLMDTGVQPEPSRIMEPIKPVKKPGAGAALKNGPQFEQRINEQGDVISTDQTLDKMFDTADNARYQALDRLVDRRNPDYGAMQKKLESDPQYWKDQLGHAAYEDLTHIAQDGLRAHNRGFRPGPGAATNGGPEFTDNRIADLRDRMNEPQVRALDKLIGQEAPINWEKVQTKLEENPAYYEDRFGKINHAELSRIVKEGVTGKPGAAAVNGPEFRIAIDPETGERIGRNPNYDPTEQILAKRNIMRENSRDAGMGNTNRWGPKPGAAKRNGPQFEQRINEQGDVISTNEGYTGEGASRYPAGATEAERNAAAAQAAETYQSRERATFGPNEINNLMKTVETVSQKGIPQNRPKPGPALMNGPEFASTRVNPATGDVMEAIEMPARQSYMDSVPGLGDYSRQRFGDMATPEEKGLLNQNVAPRHGGKSNVINIGEQKVREIARRHGLDEDKLVEDMKKAHEEAKKNKPPDKEK